EPRERLELELADALAREIEDCPDVFERGSAAVRDVERARNRHFPNFQIGKVELDGARARRNVEIQVVPTRNVWARARPLGAFGTLLGPLRFELLPALLI